MSTVAHIKHFTSPGEHLYDVPQNASSMLVECWGAGGGGGQCPGGNGAFVTGTFPIPALRSAGVTIMHVLVGEGGGSPVADYTAARGGFNGGGLGGKSNFPRAAGGGGGWSGVRFGSDAEPKIVAGAGGGGGAGGAGGDAGKDSAPRDGTPGRGATATAGGAAGKDSGGIAGTDGSKYQGGIGGHEAGGGGGGGLFGGGGGGGSSTGTGGGGGSSLGEKVSLTGAKDPYGHGGAPRGQPNANGQHGAVRITFFVEGSGPHLAIEKNCKEIARQEFIAPGEHKYDVPKAAVYVRIECWGGGGGGGAFAGGHGAYATATWFSRGGNDYALRALVAGAGSAPTKDYAAADGGANGGGASGKSNFPRRAGSGGGWSGVFVGSEKEPRVVAAGGGGAGNGSAGGSAGCASPPRDGVPGQPGSAYEGGLPGKDSGGISGTAGSKLQGGVGGHEAGGGGGGGFFGGGGGGGSSTGTGGGGGSSFGDTIELTRAGDAFGHGGPTGPTSSPCAGQNGCVRIIILG